MTKDAITAARAALKARGVKLSRPHIAAALDAARAAEAKLPTRCTMYDRRAGRRCINTTVPGKSLCAGPHDLEEPA